MTERRANILAAKAKPCPFCGQYLVIANDHHGFWLAHPEPTKCFEGIAQILDAADLQQWNQRA